MALDFETGQGALLVGSVPVSSASEVFHRIFPAFQGRLRRVPDGETGQRDTFVAWQVGVFSAVPQVLIEFPHFNKVEEIPEAEIQAAIQALPKPLKTGYDDAAIASYAEFCKARDEGIIPKGIKFQVCLPTPINVMLLVKEPFRAHIEPKYEEAIIDALTRIQTAIPHEDLDIQFDLAGDVGLIERSYFPNPWFHSLMDGVVDRAVQLIRRVAEDVDVGLHLCYGDLGHQHFKEPENLALLVELFNTVLARADRDIQWIHMPVPKDRNDPAYFAPLKDIQLPEKTELYLGVIHPGDEDGSKEKMVQARNVLQRQFGVATECGMGRTPIEDLEPIIQASLVLSKPVGY